jgi:hypothetical protein
MTMIVKTINPVIVNGKKESRSSKYLSFDANGKPEKSKPNEVKSFQTFAKSKGANLGTSGVNKDGVDGKWGTSTEKAWATHGSAYVAMAKALGNTMLGMTTNTGTAPTTEPTKDEQIAQAKKGKIWDKAKGWITSDKAKDALAFLQNSGGIRGLFGSIFGGGSSDQGTGSVQTSSEGSYGSGLPTEVPSEKPKWSTGKKVAVFGGGALVLGLIIYFATRPKTGK